MAVITPLPSGMKLDVVLTTEDADGKQSHSKRTIELTVADQRALAEAEAGGPCFRMWLSDAEKIKADFMDWTCYRLSDGRWAVWRKQADIDILLGGGSHALAAAINARRLEDSET